MYIQENGMGANSSKLLKAGIHVDDESLTSQAWETECPSVTFW